MCGVLLSVEEEAESDCEDPGRTDHHSAQHKCKKCFLGTRTAKAQTTSVISLDLGNVSRTLPKDLKK